MSFGISGGNRKSNYNLPPSDDDDATVGTASVIFNINGKKHKLLKEHLKRLSKKYAKMARDMGGTNDEEAYSEQMTEDIFEALQKAQKNYNSQSL